MKFAIFKKLANFQNTNYHHHHDLIGRRELVICDGLCPPKVVCFSPFYYLFAEGGACLLTRLPGGGGQTLRKPKTLNFSGAAADELNRPCVRFNGIKPRGGRRAHSKKIFSFIVFTENFLVIYELKFHRFGDLW